MFAHLDFIRLRSGRVPGRVVGGGRRHRLPPRLAPVQGRVVPVRGGPIPMIA